MVAIGKEMVFLGKKILQGKSQGISLQVFYILRTWIVLYLIGVILFMKLNNTFSVLPKF